MNFANSGFFSGTSRPFEHFGQEIVRGVAASGIASALFSTASHFPNGPTRGFVAVDGRGSGFTSAGLSLCAAKITFELGNRMPLINWERFAEAANTATAPAPFDAGAALGVGDCAFEL